MADASPGDSFKAVDFRASRATATSPELAQYKVIHFATHGVLDSRTPALSGIVLSLVDRKGKSVDGFLRVWDIYNLHLSAELVVLSACQTALGTQIKGEGLVGMTRGFMYAGSARVIASLWQVNDVASSELMAQFYRNLLKKNLPPAAALRAAQVYMWKQKRWQGDPYFWGAFQLQGEWK
jgi:CHAT domain-containing protein